jgi:hypothetical protein
MWFNFSEGCSFTEHEPEPTENVAKSAARVYSAVRLDVFDFNNQKFFQ